MKLHVPADHYPKDVLKPGLLYRSARPDAATPEDRHRLVHDFKIKTIIDLRTPTEHVEQAKKLKASLASEQDAPNRIPEISYKDVNFNGSAYSRALISQLPYLSTAKLAGLYVLGYRKDAISVLAKHVMAPRGLIGLAEDSLRFCRAEVKLVFDILCEKENYPVVVHCTQGKDRTGLIVGLVLLLLGVGTEAIEADYQLTGPELAKEREEKVMEVRSIGLPDEFADCTEGYAERVKGFIDSEFGGAEAYLEGCGVSRGQMDSLKGFLKALPSHSYAGDS